ncbi:aspartate/glutamate racemase family protein [Sphingomonas sp. DT-51]
MRMIGLIGGMSWESFYKGRLRDAFGLEVIVPEAADRATVHRIIYDELVAGRVEPASRAAFGAVIARLVASAAEAVILGCTEILMLVGQDDSPVPIFDTTALHAAAALDRALSVERDDEARRAIG